MCYEVTESNLIEISQLLDAIADDDDIEWKTDPFEMRPESANPETPDEIRNSWGPLQRIHWHILYIGPVPARTGRPNGYRNRSNEVGGATQPPPPSTPFCWKSSSHPHAGQQTAGARHEWSQAHPVPKGDGQWQLTLDFVQLNAAKH